jgi:hypothetical protein
MTDHVPEHPRSPRPVQGTAGLRGFSMQASIVIDADYGMRGDGAKRAMPSTSTTPNLCISKRFVCPTPKEGQGEQG